MDADTHTHVTLQAATGYISAHTFSLTNPINYSSLILVLNVYYIMQVSLLQEFASLSIYYIDNNNTVAQSDVPQINFVAHSCAPRKPSNQYTNGHKGCLKQKCAGHVCQ